MVQRRQPRLFSVKLQAGHIHVLVVGSSAMVDVFFFRRLYRLESFDTLFDDNPEPSAARATSNKCEVGMARKRVSAHLRSAWQQKPGVMHRYAKDTILKNLFPPVLLRICVSVCELKKSQPQKNQSHSTHHTEHTSPPWASTATASTAVRGSPLPVLAQGASSQHRGRLPARSFSYFSQGVGEF